MATLLFDIFPATGHYNASLLLASRLAETNKVIFVCEKEYEQKVRKAGFEVYPIKKHILPCRFSVRYTRFSPSISFYCLSRFYKKEDEQHIKEERLVHKQMLEKIQPDLVCLDSHHFYKKFLYESYLQSGRLLRVQTMQSTLRYPYLFPICYDYLPIYSSIGYRIANITWKWYQVKSKWISYIDQLLFPRKNIIYHLRTLAGISNNNIRRKIDYDRYTPKGVEFHGGKEIVIPPTAFNFPVIENENVLSLKRHLDQENRDELLSPRYLKCLNKIKDLRKHGKKIIYISLGTLSMNDKKKAIHFFRELKEVCNKTDGTNYYIISISKNVFPADFIPYSSNIFLFKRIPQLHLLSYCDLMITHGGMNSITECISKEVPMLVYPLDKNWDQPGNAARVVFHGLGLKGNIRWATSSSIKRKIDSIWDNYEFHKNKIREMKTHIASEPDSAINYINTLLG